MNNMIITKTRELAKLLQQDESIVRLTAAQEAYVLNVEVQDMVDKFNMTREKINAAVADGTSDEKEIDKLNEELRNYYTWVMESESMINFNSAKQDADKLLGFMVKILTESAEGEDPDTIQPENEGGCDGSSCSSCGGGCH
ncbi:MAG: YlbF family regulator [Oscillospiraceae bacterium]